MHQSLINSHSSVYSRVLLSKETSLPWKDCFSLVSAVFLLPPSSIPTKRKGSYALLSIPVICRMDRSQLIWRWQEALLLAHWLTSAKDWSHQLNRHCPQIDPGRIPKPRFKTSGSSPWQFRVTWAPEGWAEPGRQIPTWDITPFKWQDEDKNE